MTPRHVMDALGKTMIVCHALDRQVFDGDQINGIDDAAAVLMRAISPSLGCPLMHARHHLAPLRAFWRPLFFFAEAALRPGERAFLAPKGRLAIA